MSRRPAGPLDVLVIGGGQAGLAMGYHLAQRGLRFLIVDAGAEIGRAWRSRWDSLRLFTPARYDNLPGLPFPAAADTYPGKDDVADYLQAYAAEFELPVRLNTTGDIADPAATAGTSSRRAPTTLEARQVVVATGPFQTPFIPPVAADLDAGRAPDPQRRLPAARSSCRRDGCWSSAPRTPAARSPWSSPRPETVELSAGQRHPDDPAAAAGPRRLVVGDRAAAGPGHRGLAAGTTAGRTRPGDRRRPAAAGPPPRRPAPAPRRRRGRADRHLRRRHRAPSTTPSCGRPGSPRTTRGSTSPTPPTSGDACGNARRHPVARAVHARPDLAAHPRLGAARLGRQRRRLPRRADRSPGQMSG